MSRSANVQSIQTLKDFKLAMINFAEDARNALSGVDMELRRMRDWLERDQLGYWQVQVKRRSEQVMQARSDLHRRKISQQGSDAVSDTEQKEALREAMKRLRYAEEKVALIKRLIPQLHHAIAEYHSHSQPLGDHLTGGFERSVLTMEKMVIALESYVATTAPSAPRFDSSETSSSSAATTSAAAGGSADGTGAEAGSSPADAQASSPAAGAPPSASSPSEQREPAPAGPAATAGRSA